MFGKGQRGVVGTDIHIQKAIPNYALLLRFFKGEGGDRECAGRQETDRERSV